MVASLEAAGYGTAAFIVDSAFCSSGVPDVPDGYLRISVGVEDPADIIADFETALARAGLGEAAA